jgi:hypothetical protein
MVCSFTSESVMTKFSSETMRGISEDSEIWANLSAAIADSSGFKGWQQQQQNASLDAQPLDKQVRRYLRETLATLAY